MLRTRVVKTASGASAVQVIYYRNRRRVIFKHIGSARNNQELESLMLVARDLIKNTSADIPLFEDVKLDNLLYLDKCEFLGVYSTFLYDTLSEVMAQMGLNKIKKQLLL
jgi:hypothetical protein